MGSRMRRACAQHAEPHFISGNLIFHQILEYYIVFQNNQQFSLVVDDLLMYILDFPLPRHTLIDGGTSERVRESVEPIVKHIIVVDQFNQISALKLRQQLHRREDLLGLRFEEALIDVI